MQEVRARGGELFVFSDSDSRIESSEGVHVIRMPEHYGLLSPILHVVPLQLLAYHTACSCARGTDVDKPRNLAKLVRARRVQARQTQTHLADAFCSAGGAGAVMPASQRARPYSRGVHHKGAWCVRQHCGPILPVQAILHSLVSSTDPCDSIQNTAFTPGSVLSASPFTRRSGR